VNNRHNRQTNSEAGRQTDRQEHRKTNRHWIHAWHEEQVAAHSWRCWCCDVCGRWLNRRDSSCQQDTSWLHCSYLSVCTAGSALLGLYCWVCTAGSVPLALLVLSEAAQLLQWAVCSCCSGPCAAVAVGRVQLLGWIHHGLLCPPLLMLSP
jgi:hypothetical protein